MTTFELKTQIQKKLDDLQQKISSLSPAQDAQSFILLIDDYASIFHDLFEPENADNYAGKIDARSSKPVIDFYLSTLNSLKNGIENLPFDPSIKRPLLNIITDHIDDHLLSRYAQGTLSQKQYQQIVKSIHPHSMVNIVEVRTWGTQREISSGLRNVLRQQLQGEGVGHASVTMRLKADDRGRKLVHKYCLNDDGSIKIPFEIKQFGTEAIYEIYWSYWPEGLQTLDNDIKTELSGIEHQDDLDVLQQMPLELKSRYLNQKYTKAREFPVLGTLRDLEGGALFESNVKGSRVMGLSPAATFDAATIESDIFRRNYLELKIQEYKLDEEISSLQLLRDNYLTTNGQFGAASLDAAKMIKPSSNFLVLLKRFRDQLSEHSVAAQILLSRQISPEQANALLNSLRLLLKQKEAQNTKLAEQIQQAASLIQENQAEIDLLKQQLQDLRVQIGVYKDSVSFTKNIIAVFQKVGSPDSTHTLTDKEVENFKKFNGIFDGSNNSLIKMIVENRSIHFNDAQKLEPLFKRYFTDIHKKLNKESNAYSEKLNVLRITYESKKEERLAFIEKHLDTLDKLILTNQEEYTRFLSFSEQIRPQFKAQEQFQKAKLTLNQVEAHIERLLLGNKPAQKTKAKKKTPSAVISPKSAEVVEIAYEAKSGVEIYQIKTLDDAIRLRNKIVADIPQQQTATSGKKEQKKNAESFTFHDVKGKESSQFIHTEAQLAALESQLTNCRQTLLKKREAAFTRLISLKIGSSTSLDELVERKIRRGTSNNVLLEGFDVEKMLEKASELASTEKEFHLGSENCSTTSMKLLHAGAPQDKKLLFTWQEVKAGEKVASNAFLTNPQTVYSAAKIVEQAAKGDPKAQTMVQKKLTAKAERNYNAMLNQLVAEVTTYNDVHLDNIGKTPAVDGSKRNQFSWSFLLKFIPHVLKLYRDFFQNMKVQSDSPETLQAKVAQEIKALNSGQAYSLIESPNASLAIYQMLEKLKQNKTFIPFFETDTLARVEQYVLSIEANMLKTKQNQEVIANYQQILAERDARIQCVESAIIAGTDINKELETRDALTMNMVWTISNDDKEDALVKLFVRQYQAIRNRDPFSFLTSNFAIKLDALATTQEKLERIQTQIQRYPNARSARAMHKCLESWPVLNDIVVSTHISDKTPFGIRLSNLF